MLWRLCSPLQVGTNETDPTYMEKASTGEFETTFSKAKNSLNVNCVFGNTSQVCLDHLVPDITFFSSSFWWL